MASGPENALAKAASVLQAMSTSKVAGNLHFIRKPIVLYKVMVELELMISGRTWNCKCRQACQ